MERILRAPQDEDIVKLYSQIRQDRDFLHAFENRPFTDTPLHLAARHGRTQLALEIQRLMPSFGQMLNSDGLSPVDLALEGDHRNTVSEMIKLNRELVRVQGREGMTPLHYAAEADDADFLAEFLLICPESINDLTIRRESAVHLAVRYEKFAAFMVLFEWLRKTCRTDVLGWRDCNGATVLDLAESTNQPQVLERLAAPYGGAPQDEDIVNLYSQIRQDPDFLHAFENRQFTETPLHLAARHGRTQLAAEIQKLMPSLGKMLNSDGFSPIDLALQGGHNDTVFAMLKLNPELVRVQGREGMTPLHYAADIDNAALVAGLLQICPESINDLTIRGESAVHLAVKYGNIEAFTALYEWLKKTDRTDVLGWREYCNGDTVLHLAASSSTNIQLQVLELLVIHTNLRQIKNFDGKIALDLVNLADVNAMAARSILEQQEDRTLTTLMLRYFLSPIGRLFKDDNFIEKGMQGDVRNAILVVAVLIATATYQGVLSPPGGLNQGNYGNTNNSTTAPIIFNNGTTANTNVTNINNTTGIDGSGKSVMSKQVFGSFILSNSAAFSLSVGIIIMLIPISWSTHVLPIALVYGSLYYLVKSYLVAAKVITPLHMNHIFNLVRLVYFIMLIPLILMVKLGLLIPAFWQLMRKGTIRIQD